MWCTPRFYFGTTFVFLYVNGMSQAVKCHLFLYADYSCLACQHKNINKIEEQLNVDLCNICDWFVDKTLSIHFGEDKTESILFASKFKKKTLKNLT